MQENLSDLFYYDPTSPTFLRWKVDRWSGRKYSHRRIAAGDVAGALSGDGGYYNTYYMRKLMRVHRIIALLHGMVIPPGYGIDHKDGNGLNNAIGNLRITTQQDNCKNRKKQHNNTSGVAGVSLKTDSLGRSYWVARWQVNTTKRGVKTFSVGLYGDAIAYQKAVEHRLLKIEALISQGHAYTNRHGK